MNKARKANKPFVFTIITKGYLYRTLENQLQNNIARYNLRMPRTDVALLDTTRHYSQYIYEIYEVKFNIHQADATISFQISKNKPRKKNIVSQLILQYKG